MPTPIRTLSRDEDTVRLLHPERYTCLPANWITALVGGHPHWHAKRLRLLADGLPDRPGLGYLERDVEWFRHRVYSRTALGDAFVGELNPHRSKQPQAHQLLQDMAQASVQIGAMSRPAFEFIDWLRLRDEGWTERGVQKYVPDKTLNKGDPHLIQLSYRCGDCDERFAKPTKTRQCPSCKSFEILHPHSRGDGTPFLLKHAGRQLFIIAKEIDRGTEPFTTTHESRRNIKQKLEHYKEIFDNDIYKSHYGFPNGMVMFLFTTATRHASFLTLQAQIFPRGCPYIFSIQWKDWANERSYPPPTDYIFTTPGKRCGYPDFSLADL